MMNLRENPLRLKSPVDESRLPALRDAVMLDILDRWENRHGVIPDDMPSPVDKVLLSMVGPRRTKIPVGGLRRTLGEMSVAFLDDAVLSLRESFNVASDAEAVEQIESRWFDLSASWHLAYGDEHHKIRLDDPAMAAAVLKQARRIRECEQAELDALNDAMSAGASVTPEMRERYMSALAATDEAKRGLPMARRSLSDIIDDCTKRWQSTQGQASLGLHTPRFPLISDMLFGWRGLIFVAAMPGIGKTTLALAAGIDAVENNDACFVFVSFEMPTGTLVNRVLSDMSGIPQRMLHVGLEGPDAVERSGLRLRDKQHNDIGEAMTRLSCLSDRVSLIGKDDIGTLRGQSSDGRDSMSVVLQAVEEAKRRSGKSRSFVVLDHLGVIPVERGDGESFANDTDRTRYILSGLTTLRDRLDGERNPVLVVAQARKADWDNASLASIMGTADTAYSADAAIVMQRPPEPEGEQAEPDWTAPQALVAKVAKGRDMMRYGDVRMTFDPRTSALTEDDD
jgi:KaiC/GvpD/RAD55 family RecA-like ATPase